MSMPAGYFDALYQHSEDPWGFRRRWYERRKRELALATLPRQRYAYIFEPGCSNGELSVALAERCDRLLSCDISARATALARERLAAFPGAEVRTARLPEEWPAGPFDLIVLSELGYYLGEADLQRLIQRCLDSLSADGALLACHWLHPILDCPLDGRQVHRLLHANLPLQRAVRHEESDFLLELWCGPHCTLDLDEDAL